MNRLDYVTKEIKSCLEQRTDIVFIYNDTLEDEIIRFVKEEYIPSGYIGPTLDEGIERLNNYLDIYSETILLNARKRKHRKETFIKQVYNKVFQYADFRGEESNRGYNAHIDKFIDLSKIKFREVFEETINEELNVYLNKILFLALIWQRNLDFNLERGRALGKIFQDMFLKGEEVKLNKIFNVTDSVIAKTIGAVATKIYKSLSDEQLKEFWDLKHNSDDEFSVEKLRANILESHFNKAALRRVLSYKYSRIGIISIEDKDFMFERAIEDILERQGLTAKKTGPVTNY